MLQFKNDFAYAISLRAVGHYVGKLTPKHEKMAVSLEKTPSGRKAITDFFDEVNTTAAQIGREIVDLGTTREMTDDELERIFAKKQQAFNSTMADFGSKARRILKDKVKQDAYLSIARMFNELSATNFAEYFDKVQNSRSERLSNLLTTNYPSYWTNVFPELNSRWTGKNLVKRAVNNHVIERVKSRLELEAEDGGEIDDNKILDKIAKEVIGDEIDAATSEIDRNLMKSPEIQPLKNRLEAVVSNLFERNEDAFLEAYDEIAV